MTPAKPLIFRRLLIPAAITFAVAVVAALSARPAHAQSVWELTPYHIQVLVATQRSPQLSPQFEEALGAELLARADAVVGAPWEVTLARAPDALRRASLAAVEDVTIESLPEGSLRFDKVLLLTVAPLPTGYQVTARELDVRTQTWNAAVRVVAWQAGKLRDAAFRAMVEAFAPLTQIGEVDTGNKLVTLRVRAAALPTRDAEFQPVVPGDLFLPVVRYDDREGNPKRITTVPWTFLRAERVSQTLLDCQLHTGLRSPLTGRMRGRVQRLALAVVPPQTPTRLVLKSRTEAARLLTGYDVYSQSLDSKATQLLGRSDRRGSVTVPPGGPLPRLLLIKHGGLALARLPVVPGLQPELEATVADDDQRLEAEGYLAGLQEDLIDLVTRRQLLLAQAQARLDAGEFDEADELARKLQQLKTRDEFTRELAQEQQKTFADDAAVQAQIDAMFGNTRKLLAQYLDPKPIEALTDAIATARAGNSS